MFRVVYQEDFAGVIAWIDDLDCYVTVRTGRINGEWKLSWADWQDARNETLTVNGAVTQFASTAPTGRAEFQELASRPKATLVSQAFDQMSNNFALFTSAVQSGSFTMSIPFGGSYYQWTRNGTNITATTNR